MKKIFKGIRINLCLSFFFFTSILIITIFTIQALSLKSYYRDLKLSNIDSFIDDFSKIINTNNFRNEDAFKVVLDNNACLSLFNSKGKLLYWADSIGDSCILNRDEIFEGDKHNFNKNPDYLINKLSSADNYTLTYESKINNKDMLLYAKKIDLDLVSYYMIINTTLEPIDSYYFFIYNQIFYIAGIVFIFALIFAYYLAHKFTSPLISLSRYAKSISYGYFPKIDKEKTYFNEYQSLLDSLSEASDKLSKLDDLRKDLISNVSHDIKTPLTNIAAYAEMIKDISGNDPIKRNMHLDTIISEVDYLNKLTNDLNDLANYEIGYINLKKSNFDLDKLILEVINSYNSFNYNFITNLDPCLIFADKLKIKQVLHNFISNAIKYSEEGSEIRINLKKQKKDYLIEIIDEGIGIKLEEQPYVWDRYYKIEKKFNRNIKQTGLGLSIVRAILLAHNYKFGLKSKVNEGSNFFFMIPKEDSHD